MQATENAIQHVNVKFYIRNAENVRVSDAIGVFHKWIQEDKVDDLLIDVADYGQVPQGPGILLIGHNAFYSLDNNKGRLGVLYNRRTIAEGSTEEQLKDAIEKARKFARMLADAAPFQGKVEFDDTELLLLVNDRKLAPNTDETLAALKPEIESALKATLGDAGYTFEREADPRARFSLNVKSDKPFTV